MKWLVLGLALTVLGGPIGINAPDAPGAAHDACLPVLVVPGAVAPGPHVHLDEDAADPDDRSAALRLTDAHGPDIGPERQADGPAHVHLDVTWPCGTGTVWAGPAGAESRCARDASGWTCPLEPGANRVVARSHGAEVAYSTVVTGWEGLRHVVFPQAWASLENVPHESSGTVRVTTWVGTIMDEPYEIGLQARAEMDTPTAPCARDTVQAWERDGHGRFMARVDLQCSLEPGTYWLVATGRDEFSRSAAVPVVVV